MFTDPSYCMYAVKEIKCEEKKILLEHISAVVRLFLNILPGS